VFYLLAVLCVCACNMLCAHMCECDACGFVVCMSLFVYVIVWVLSISIACVLHMCIVCVCAVWLCVLHVYVAVLFTYFFLKKSTFKKSTAYIVKCVYMCVCFYLYSLMLLHRCYSMNFWAFSNP